VKEKCFLNPDLSAPGRFQFWLKALDILSSKDDSQEQVIKQLQHPVIHSLAIFMNFFEQKYSGKRLELSWLKNAISSMVNYILSILS
jgi:hypothetical protein